jgi:hypothetical protein
MKTKRYFIIEWHMEGQRYALNGTDREELFKKLKTISPKLQGLCHEVDENLCRACGNRELDENDFWSRFDSQMRFDSDVQKQPGGGYFIVTWFWEWNRYASAGTDPRELRERVKAIHPDARLFNCHPVDGTLYHGYLGGKITDDQLFAELDKQVQQQRAESQFLEAHPECGLLEGLPLIGHWLKETGISRDRVVMAFVLVAMIIVGISICIGFLHSYGVFE